MSKYRITVEGKTYEMDVELIGANGAVVAPVAKAAPAAQGDDDTELVAVIAAAICAYEASQGNAVSPDSLVVRSIRKVNKSKWQNA